jgi:acetylglutamate kinase
MDVVRGPAVGALGAGSASVAETSRCAHGWRRLDADGILRPPLHERPPQTECDVFADAARHPLMTTAVLKLGGEVIADAAGLGAVLEQIRSVQEAGWRIAVVHGGGPQAEQLSTALGLRERKVDGRRVTDEPTLRVMKQVLAGELNVDLVAAAAARGVRAVGLCGVSTVVHCRRLAPQSQADGTAIDYGLVGEIERIDTMLLEHLWSGGFTPMIAPLGFGRDGVLNINADTVAAGVAAAVRADHLFVMTAVAGVRRDRDDPSTRIPTLSIAEARDAIDDGTIAGGMIPKVADALPHLGAGIGTIHILGPRVASLAEAAAQPGRFGTALLSQPLVVTLPTA